MISPRAVLFAIGLGAGVANAVLSKGALCEYNSTPIGEYCASGLACVRSDLWGSGYCQSFKCPTVNAPEATITVAPATITAAEATSTVYVTSTKYDLCLCPPTLIYTTTVTGAAFAAAAPTATVAAGGICASNSACAEGLSCVPSANGASRCFKAACVDDTLATKTITEQSTITAAPLAVTTTATVTTKVKTGSVTCSCLPGAQTTTITYTVSPKETGA